MIENVENINLTIGRRTFNHIISSDNNVRYESIRFLDNDGNTVSINFEKDIKEKCYHIILTYWYDDMKKDISLYNISDGIFKMDIKIEYHDKEYADNIMNEKEIKEMITTIESNNGTSE